MGHYEEYLIEVAREITAYLIKSGAPAPQAEDVAQDLLLQILEAEIPVAADKLRAWMYRTAVRRYIDRYRRDRRYQELLQTHFFTEQTLTPFDDGDYDFLYEAMAALKPKFYQILDLYYLQGFSQAEISQILQVSQAYVKVNLMRGRQALKKILESRGYTHEML